MGDRRVVLPSMSRATRRASGSVCRRTRTAEPTPTVLKPWVNGMDLTRRPAGKWIVDFGWTMSAGAAVRGAVPGALRKRTLTNLYNDSPQWLVNAHGALDAAVATAYGWPADINDEDALRENVWISTGAREFAALASPDCGLFGVDPGWWVFRRKWNTESGGSGTAIPEEVEQRIREVEHGIRRKWNSDSGGSGTAVPEVVNARR